MIIKGKSAKVLPRPTKKEPREWLKMFFINGILHAERPNGEVYRQDTDGIWRALQFGIDGKIFVDAGEKGLFLSDEWGGPLEEVKEG